MSVYVDALIDYKKTIGRLGPSWCHMTADTTAELMAMADRIGLPRAYVQHAGRATEHFDLTPSKRALAEGGRE